MKREELKRDLEALQQEMEKVGHGLVRALLCANYLTKVKDLSRYGVPLEERMRYQDWLREYMDNYGVGKW